MPKLTLNLDGIRVESFSPGSTRSVAEMIPTTTQSQNPSCSCPTFCPC